MLACLRTDIERIYSEIRIRSDELRIDNTEPVQLFWGKRSKAIAGGRIGFDSEIEIDQSDLQDVGIVNQYEFSCLEESYRLGQQD
jgi:hypothetical protein